MKTRSTVLWKKTFYNSILSIVIFGGLMLLLWLMETIMPDLQLLRWDDAAWCVGIPASVIGVAYILSVRDPENYTGFYPGIIMSLLLALQSLLQGNYDLAILFIVVFVPFLIMSIVKWKEDNKAKTDSEHLSPEFLSWKDMLCSIGIFLLIVVIDYLAVTFIFNKDSMSTDVLVKIVGGIMIASSVLANFWLIYRKTDAWIYWVIYSVSGIAFYIIVSNVFSVVLFSFFLLVNGSAGVAWVRLTPKENRGWINKLFPVVLIALLPALFSCGKTSQPKPYGYFRLDIPDTAYASCTYRDVCVFLKSDNSDLELKEDSNWFNLRYDRLNARIHCSYLPIENDLRELTDDAQDFVFRHAGKATAINEQGFENEEDKVWGVLYELEGNIASPYQFFLTDSVKHFLRASVYFESIPNQDSLQPAIDYMLLDVRKMMESLKFF